MVRSLKINYLYQAAWQLLVILVPLVTVPYLSRVLGASQVGVYSFTYSVTNYFVMFATLGMSTYGVRAIAECGDDIERRSSVFWNAYAGQVIVGIAVLVVYIVYTFSDPRGGFIVAAVWGMWVVSALLDVSWLLFGVEEFKVPTIRSIITKLASVAVIFIFVRGSEDLWIYCAAIAGSFLINQILIWPFVGRYILLVKPKWHGIRLHFIPNLRLFIPVIAISLYVTLDKVMLGVMTDMTQVGFFEYSDKLSRLPMALITAMGTVMLPRMTLELRSGNRENALGLLENSIWAMLVMAFALMFGIMGIAPEFAVVFLGEEFASCDFLICVLALVIPVVSITNVLGRQYLLPTERDSRFTVSVCVGAAVNICMNILLIPTFAAVGAAISTVCAEVSVLIAQIACTYKELPLRIYFQNAIPYFACGVLMMFSVRVSASIFNDLWGMSILGLALEVLIGVVAFCLLAIVWCLLSRDKHALAVLGQIKRR